MEKGRPKKDNVKDSSIARRLQRQNKKDGVLVKVGRKTICEKVKEELKKNGIEGVKKLMDSKKVSKLGLKKCVKEGKLDKELLDKLGIKMNKSSVAKKAVKKVLAKKAPKKDKDEKPRGSKGGGGGGGSGESQSKVQAPVPAEKLVQQIAPSQEPLTAMEFLNRRRMEMGDDRLRPITESELARARVLVAEQQKKEFGKSFPEGDPHAKPPGFKTQNPLNTHNNVAGITSTNASIQNQVDKDFEEFTRKLREETKKEAQTNLDSLLSNVDEAVARGFEKAELRLDAPVLGNFVLQGEPTQQSTLQQQSGFNQGNLSQPRTIAQTQLEQDEARVAHHYDRYDHSVISQYASGNPTDVKVELASNQDELEPEEFEEESESEEEEEESPTSSRRMMGLFV